MLHRIPVIKKIPHVQQLAKFGVVGLANTFIDYTTYFVLTRNSDFFKINYLLANLVAFIFAIIFSFFMNRFWTFRSKSHKQIVKQYMQFITVSVIGLFMAQTLLYIFVSVLGISDIYGKIMTTGIVVFWNFYMNKFWTFKQLTV